jgi:hypothetical protein
VATGPACHWRTTSIRCAASCRNAPSRKRLALRLPPCAGPPAVHHATHAAQPQKREQTTRGRSRVRHPPPRDPRAPPARGEARSPSAPRSPLAPLASDREQSPRPAPPYTPPSPHSATTSTAGARRRRRVALSSLPPSPNPPIDDRSRPPARRGAMSSSAAPSAFILAPSSATLGAPRRGAPPFLRRANNLNFSFCAPPPPPPLPRGATTVLVRAEAGTGGNDGPARPAERRGDAANADASSSRQPRARRKAAVSWSRSTPPALGYRITRFLTSETDVWVCPRAGLQTEGSC